MRLSNTVITTCIQLFVLSTTAFPANLTLRPQSGISFAPRVAKPPAIDGSLNEWNMKFSTVAFDPKTIASLGGYMEPWIDTATDGSARLAYAWDTESLYIAVSVTDNERCGIPRDEKNVKMPWEYDGIFMHLRGMGPGAQAGRYHPISSSPGSRDPMIGLSYFTSDSRGRQLPGKSRYVAKDTLSGYTLEAQVEWSGMGFRVAPNDRFRWLAIYVDRDIKDTTPFGQILYHCGDLASEGADLRLLNGGNVGGEVILDRTLVSPGTSLRVKGRVEALNTPAKLTAVSVMDGTHIERGRAAVAGTVPAGQVGEFTVNLPTGQLRVGDHTVLLRLVQGDKRVASAPSASVRVFETATRDADGTPSHQPKLVGDPARGYHAADARTRGDRPPVPPAANRDTYVRLLRSFYDIKTKYNLENARKGGKDYWAQIYALSAAALFQCTGETRFAEESKLFFDAYRRAIDEGQSPYVPGMPSLLALRDAIKDIPTYTDTDRAWFAKVFLAAARSYWPEGKGKVEDLERGAQNRATACALTLQAVLNTNPDLPEAPLWKEYITHTWNDWWAVRDTDENTGGYTQAWLAYCFYLAFEMRLGDEFWKDFGLKRLMERCMFVQAPCGVRPLFGSSNWHDLGYYPALFEIYAKKTGDGRFRWASFRMIEYAEAQVRDWFQYHIVTDSFMAPLATAALWADDSVPPQQPFLGSKVLLRKFPEYLPPDRRRAEKFNAWFRMTERDVPDKIILSSGPDPHALWAIVDVTPYCGHAGIGASDLLTILRHGSALLAGRGYYEHGPEYRNCFNVEDLEGINKTPTPHQTTVPVMSDLSEVVISRAHNENYYDKPVTLNRDFVLVKDRFLWVRDRATFVTSFYCRIGPGFNTRQVPEMEENWASTYFDFLFLTGLGKGLGVHQWSNPNWDLLLHFAPQTDRKVERLDRMDENPWMMAPQRIQQTWTGIPRAGETFSFSSLLLPHHPNLPGKQLAEGVTVLTHQPDATALKVVWRDQDRWLGIKPDTAETIYLVLNDTGQSITAGALTTDAVLAYLRFGRDGKAARLILRNATRFTLDGKTWHASAQAVDVDKAMSG